MHSKSRSADGQNTLRPDNTPSFTMGQDVDKLPQLPGSGLINSIPWKASNDDFVRTGCSQKRAAAPDQSKTIKAA
jgi:hypothetical protein